MTRSRLMRLGYNYPPTPLPQAWRPKQAPQLAALRNTSLLQGFGHYGQRALSRMGQDDDSGFDWSQFETELPALTTAATTGTASLINAVNAPGIAQTNANARIATAEIQSSSLFSNPSTLLLIGGVVLVVVMMRQG